MQTPAARPVNVLIASTHEWTSRSLASILAPLGYVVHKTYNRAQTLARIRSNPPDAIIVDEQLPDGDSYELCRELTEQILISPSTPLFLSLPRPPTRRDRLAALHANVWACLGEPLDAEELVAMLEVFVPAKLDADEGRTRSLVDEATGFYNQRGLMRRAEELAAQAARRHSSLCCVLLVPEIEAAPEAAPEADGLPLWLLHRVAVALRSAARRSDAIGRLSTNAFAIVATDTDASQSRRLAERLAAAIVVDPHTPSIPPVPRVRIRAGCHAVSDLGAGPQDVATLMSQAESALRRARADSQNGWIQAYSV